MSDSPISAMILAMLVLGSFALAVANCNDADECRARGGVPVRDVYNWNPRHVQCIPRQQ